MPIPPRPSMPWHLLRSKLLPVLLLAGCVGADGGARNSSQPILAGAMMLAPPPGYCVVSGSRLERGDTALALMGRCDSGPEGGPEGGTAIPAAILTTTIGASGSATGLGTAGLTDLANWLASPKGRSALGRQGRAGDVRLSGVTQSDGMLVMQVTDRGADPATDPASWRAMLPLRGRLVSLSVAGPRGTPLPPEAGRRLIGAFAAAMRKANP